LETTEWSHLKKEALDRTVWVARFGRGFGPVVRQTTKWMNDISSCKYTSTRGLLLKNKYKTIHLNIRKMCLI
jgi:hypothetical protein